MEAFIEALLPWGPSIGAFLFFTFIRFIYKYIVLSLLHGFYDRTSFRFGADILNAFETPINVVLYFIGFYSAIHLAPIAGLKELLFADRIMRSCLVICFFWGFFNLSDTTHGVMKALLTKAGIGSEDSLANIFATIARLLIIILCFVTVAKEWNYDISGFLASLSIGSVAVAFAAKDALANVFGTLIILLDKPFKVGDWIMANDIEGTVERISFRSTCVRTFPLELVYIPNSLMSNTPIMNFDMRAKRRIDFNLNINAATPHENLEQFIMGMREYLENNPCICKDEDIRTHFRSYGTGCLEIGIMCFANTNEQHKYLDILQDLNFHILDLMKKSGARFALPASSIYFESPLRQHTFTLPPKVKSN